MKIINVIDIIPDNGLLGAPLLRTNWKWISDIGPNHTRLSVDLAINLINDISLGNTQYIV